MEPGRSCHQHMHLRRRKDQSSTGGNQNTVVFFKESRHPRCRIRQAIPSGEIDCLPSDRLTFFSRAGRPTLPPTRQGVRAFRPSSRNPCLSTILSRERVGQTFCWPIWCLFSRVLRCMHVYHERNWLKKQLSQDSSCRVSMTRWNFCKATVLGFVAGVWKQPRHILPMFYLEIQRIRLV